MTKSHRCRRLTIAALVLLALGGGLWWPILRQRTVEDEERFFASLARHPFVATVVQKVFDLAGRHEEFVMGWTKARVRLAFEVNPALLEPDGCVLLDVPTPAEEFFGWRGSSPADFPGWFATT